MNWKLPPRIKIYEALGCVADERLKLNEKGADVISSDGTKTYTVLFDAEQKMICANDNGSFWQGYIGYPAIAYLLKTELLSFEPEIAELLSGIAWKKINQLHKNDWEKTEAWIYSQQLSNDKTKIQSLERYAQRLARAIDALSLQQPSKRLRPPSVKKAD